MSNDVPNPRLADQGPDFGTAVEVGVGGEGAGPGDVAVAGRVRRVSAFAENPACALVTFSQGEIIGGNVLFGCGEALLGYRELVHEAEAEIVLFAGEIYGGERAKVLAGFPADLLAEAGGIAGGLHVPKLAQEGEENGLEEVPIFGAAGEKAAEP